MANFPSLGDCFEDRFEILGHVASGGFSRIYRATQLGLEREVALKILRPEHVAGAAIDRERFDEWARRFEREARLVSQLRDPHTVTVHDYGRTDDGLLYIVFEYIDGKTIAEKRIDTPFSHERVVDILLQILFSLEEAHHHNVLHRDIKPANIMLYEHLGRQDRVKVLDFGIAQIAQIGENAGEDLTREGFILGTPRYMAPEQLRNHELTAASDLYSLGLVVWEMLVGQPAIVGDDTMAIITRQVDTEPFALPDELDTPVWLRSIIERMVAKVPSARFQSAREVRQALEDQAEQYGVDRTEASKVSGSKVSGSKVSGSNTSEPAAGSPLIDPNLAETAEAFGRESSADASVGAAVASLQQDRVKSAGLDTPRASAPSSRPQKREVVPGLEPEDGNLGLTASASKTNASSKKEQPQASGDTESDDTNSEDTSTEKKLSELTMLGVDEMLRRSEHGGGWSLGRIVAILAAIAVLGGLGFLLYRHAGSVATMPQAVKKLANEWVIHPASDSVAPEDRFSIRGLQLAIETADWHPVGDEGVVDTVDARKVMQTYRHKQHRVRAAFHDLSDRADARTLVERTELPARAVRCDTKVVVLEPATPAEHDHVEGLSLLLEDYRKAVVEIPGEDSR
jgi:serine/threonine protein kinase